MSYDLCEFEECFFTHPFSPLSDSSSIDILKSFQENNYNMNTLAHDILDTPFDEIDQIAPTSTITTTTTTTLSSTPCSQLHSLSTYQMGNSVNSKDLCHLEIKTEEDQLPFYDSYVDNNSFLLHSYGGCDNSVKMTPRTVCSTSDLHRLETKQTLSSSPLGSLMEEANVKVGRYSPEERRERILRYKVKRMQRNFNKTIKYACRKTLADNRPRIRGRFARNDEPQETPKAFTFQRYANEDELSMEGLQEEYHGLPGGHIFNTYMPTTQFHQFSYFRN